jgi:hypothetical protein
MRSDPVYQAGKMSSYPHMLPADVLVWERFLDKHAAEFSGFDYDVHVGGEVEREVGWTQEVYTMALSLASKRIDVVGYRGNETWIIEVKPVAGVTAIGQLVMYRDLYIRDFRPDRVIVCALVCENLSLDEKWQLDKLGFKYFVV